MARRDSEDEDDGGLETLLFGGGKPKISDLADPRKRNQAMRAAKLLGFEVRKEQMVRIGIGLAVVLVILLIGLWAIAKVLGLLFWAILAMGICAVVVRVIGRRRPEPKRIEAPSMPAVESDRKRVEAEEREADRRADAALDELEKRLKNS